jgi:hypothetical protein
MITEKVIKKYISVIALAQQGSPGEQDNAARIAARMEARNPGLKAAARAYKQEREPQPEPEVSPVHQHRPGPVGNWENIFAFASGMYSGLAEAAGNAIDAIYGKELAEMYVKTQVKMSRYSETVLITFRIPVDALDAARELNRPQEYAFREAMHDMLEEVLDDILGE